MDGIKWPQYVIYYYARWRFYAIFFILSIFILAIPIHIPINIYDEGIILNNSFRISLGEYPYVDFWTTYMPGQYYSVGFLFSLFGDSVLVERWWDIVIRASILIEILVFTQNKLNIGNRILIWFLSAILLSSSNSFGSPIYPAIFWALFSIRMSENYFKSVENLWIILAGLSIGFSFWYRWDFALYIGLSSLATLLLFITVHLNDFFGKSGKMRSVLLSFIAGFFVATLPFITLTIVQGGSKEFFTQAVVFPATLMRTFRWKPFPSISFPFQILTNREFLFENYFVDLNNWVSFYFPLSIFILFLLWFGKNLRKKSLCSLFFSWMTYGLFGLLMMIYALSRFDYQHILPLTVIICPIAFLVLESVTKTFKMPIRTIVFSVSSTLICISLIFSPMMTYINIFFSYSPVKCFSNFQMAHCIYMDQDQSQVVSLVNTLIKEDDKIFIGNSRHDQILINDVSLYFLVGIKGGTKYYELHPGVATTYEIQKEIINNISENDVDLVILVNNALSTEPNQSSISSHIRLLDNYINSNYQILRKYGNYVILREKQLGNFHRERRYGQETTSFAS